MFRLTDFLYRAGSERFRGGSLRKIYGSFLWAGWLFLHNCRQPLNEGNPINYVAAAARLFVWQVWRRSTRRPLIVQLPDRSLLKCPVWSQITSAWVAGGFHEYADTMFFLGLIRPDDFFVDVGANIGFYTLIARRLGAAVLAVEPHPLAAAAIVASLALNPSDKYVEVLQCALSDRAGVGVLTTDRENENRLTVRNEKVLAGIDTNLLTLDDLVGGRRLEPNGLLVIKIDTEGHDLRVLRGAESTLRDHKPVLLVEAGSSGYEIEGWLNVRNYEVFVYEPLSRYLRPVEELPMPTGNIIAVHRTGVALVRERLRNSQQPTLCRPRLRIAASLARS